MRSANDRDQVSMAGPVLFLLALAGWMASIVAGGLPAAVLFPTMREVGAIIPGMVDNPQEAWRLVAGKPATRIFAITLWCQVGCAGVGCLAFLSTRALRTSRSVLASLMAALGLLGAFALVIAPRLQQHFAEMWGAYETGGDPSGPREAFGKLHPWASRVLLAMLVALLLAFVRGVGACVRGPR